ncbi:DNA repair protein RAD4 isoform X2 [Phalaenopsis equestris]|uniref:DNA repair protein RAD4 isoform X2 n=1 Tax=Phalaenopsis equestris TaxID=78828 RepID=UPI0009E5A967|nr:DNA repair protein RAD4 isoform X2 [Phalaenopsis equestris]
MRTRNQAKRHEEYTSGTGVSKEQAGQGGLAGSLHGEGSISAVSEEAVGRLLMRANSRKLGRPRSESHYTSWEARDKMAELGNGKRKADEELTPLSSVLDTTDDAEDTILMKEKHFEKNVHYDANELDWEEGMIPPSESGNGYSHELGKEVTIEFSESPSTKQRPSRRFSVEDKELAEIVHKVHLLCLIARCRLVDSACNDRLIQASLLSLLPLNLLEKVEVSRFTANELKPLVDWFHYNFRLKSESVDRGCFKSNLASALETHEGTSEEIAALSVAFFRALNLTTRFVSNLDVVSLKPDVDMPGNSSFNTTHLNTKISSSLSSDSSPKFHTLDRAHLSDSRDEAMHPNTTNSSRLPKIGNNTTCNKKVRRGLIASISLADEKHVSTSQAGAENLGSYNEGSKRKGDLEFELQMAMALSATATTTTKSLDMDDLHNSSTSSSPMKKVRIAKTGESLFSTSHSSGGVWSRKNGPPLYWAEVYCSGETGNGRWVHVDAANYLVDGEENVEPASAVCKKPIRYVVAFAGNGAKDVTRRYCKQWYRIAPQRIDPRWWDAVLAPLKELESGETGGIVYLEEFQENVSYAMKGSSEANAKKPQISKTSEGSTSKQIIVSKDIQSALKKPDISTRNSLEDMELETRTLTEPLPTNQLAYKSHHLYAIEKWLTKYQKLHPMGPIVGYCSGHPVYPRSCVQTVQTRQKWLREGLQIRENEIPAKVIKRSKKIENDEISDTGFAEEDGKKSIELFGRWQVEPLQLPHAVNGVVPKNEYGRVDVWSEKCLPHGTVHLRLPRLASVARRLEIDFASAMVGFEFRNGRSYPVYEGIVVCTEFRDAIMEFDACRIILPVVNLPGIRRGGRDERSGTEKEERGRCSFKVVSVTLIHHYEATVREFLCLFHHCELK